MSKEECSLLSNENELRNYWNSLSINERYRLTSFLGTAFNTLSGQNKEFEELKKIDRNKLLRDIKPISNWKCRENEVDVW